MPGEPPLLSCLGVLLNPQDQWSKWRRAFRAPPTTGTRRIFGPIFRTDRGSYKSSRTDQCRFPRVPVPSTQRLRKMRARLPQSPGRLTSLRSFSKLIDVRYPASNGGVASLRRTNQTFPISNLSLRNGVKYLRLPDSLAGTAFVSRPRKISSICIGNSLGLVSIRRLVRSARARMFG